MVLDQKTSNAATIQAKNCSLQYPDGTLALKPFQLEIGRGEIAFITGPSGSGKTSLLKLIMGIEKASTGQFSVLGQEMAALRPDALQKLRCEMGPVFQAFHLFDGRTVYDNVLSGMRFLPMRKQEMTEQAEEWIEKVGLSHKRNQRVEHLSWGESQRVAIARALARRPKLIVADEPTGNLDHDNAVMILKLLAALKPPETTAVITTHAVHLMSLVPVDVSVRITSGDIVAERR